MNRGGNNKDHLPRYFVPGRTGTSLFFSDRTFDRIVMERTEAWNDWERERQSIHYPKEPEDYLIGISWLWTTTSAHRDDGQDEEEQQVPGSSGEIVWSQKPNLPPIEQVFQPGGPRVYFTEHIPNAGRLDEETNNDDELVDFPVSSDDDESVSRESLQDPNAYHRLPLSLR